MNFRYPFILLLCTFFGPHTYGQLVAPNVFLQGAYVEVGIAPNGAWGAGAAPGSYHPRTNTAPSSGTSGSNISVVYDFGHDGWTTGTPWFYGDYIFPGTPFEGWAVQVNGVYSHAYYSDGPSTFYNAAGGTLTGANASYAVVPPLAPCGSTINYGTGMTGVWNGSFGVASALQMRQTTVIDTFASWVYVNTVFKNTSGGAMPGVYYLRTCDPDNDVTYSTSGLSSFATINSVTYQNDVDHRVLVGSYGYANYHDAYLSLATKDCRAKCLIYQSWPPTTSAGNNLDLMWAGTATGLGTTWYIPGNTSVNQDIAVGLVYNLGTIAAGDSAMISYAYIFKDSTCIDSVFPEPQLVVNCVAQPPSGPAPAPTYDTFNKCDNPGVSSLPVSINYGNTKNWSWSKWSWAPSTGLATTTGVTNTINLTAVSGVTTFTITGTDSAFGMNNCANRVFYLTIIPGCVDATNNGPICAGDTLKLNSPGDSVGALYYWYGPTGFTAMGQSTIRFPTTAADSGWYSVVKVVGSVHDTGRTHVVIKPKPVINLSSNAPICSGKTLTLTAAPDSVGEIWSWTGPVGFTSGIAAPTRINAHTNYSGTYWVRATFHGCKDSNSINVVVDSTPVAPAVGSNSPICSQNPLFLTALSATAGVGYAWTGPAGFTSAVQNPNITSANTSATGLYSVVVTLGVCTNSATINVAVDSTPAQPVLTSNSPVCSGSALNLTATSTAGVNYSWTGPSGFATLVQNPTINPAFTIHSGTYTVSASQTYTVGATVHTCTSLPATIAVVVDSTPVAPTAYSNSPGAPGVSICEGDTLRLFANHLTPGVTYAWVGPNGFTSTLQNPIIINVPPTAAGAYQVTTQYGACSSSIIINVFIKPIPPITATSNSPVCSGDSLKLFATSLAGGTYSWIGPYTYITYVQNPIRVPAVTEQSGVYTVTVVVDGCKNMARDTVQVNQTPNPPTVKWLNYCQYYDAKGLTPFGTNLLWYTSSAPGGTGSSITPVPPTDIAPAEYWYYVSQTVTNCTSKIDSIKVTVNPKPTVTARKSLSVCPRDTVWLVAETPDNPITFRWSPKLYLTDTTSPISIAHPETNMHYMVVATNKYDCTDSAFTDVTVRPNAVIYLGDSVKLFPGESYQIKPQTNCTYFTWIPPAGLDNSNIANPVAKPLTDTRYVVIAETEWGCKTQDTLKIYVSDESILALPNAFVPGNGPNGMFKILKHGQAVLNHFRIYDRWGIVVFETTDIDKGWDGTYKGTPQPFGVYVYEVSAVTTIGTPINRVGNVTLIR
jgi:gliding motility-associated-like protein